MTLKLVLDENIIVLSSKMENDHGDDDPTCTILLGKIFEKKDTIFVNQELQEKYVTKLNSLDKFAPAAVYTRKMLLNLGAAGLLRFESFCPDIFDENLLPSDDVFIVRLVVRISGSLVSTDDRLEIKMNDAKVFENYKIEFLNPSIVY